MLGFFYKESLELESEEIEEVCTVRFVPTTAFSLRYIDFDRTPQGFFYEESPELELEELEEVCPVRFVPTTAFRLPSNPRLGWSLIDAHHGRVLFYDLRYRAMVVWDPITTDCRHVPVPLLYSQNHYAVLCATAGCNHRSRSGGPFIVVLVGKDKGVSYAHVYSSESEGCYVWGRAVASIEHPDSAADFSPGRSVLVENILYIPLGTKIMGYDTANQQLGVINTPSGYKGLGALMTAEDGMQGKLGLAVVQESQVHLWFRPVGLNEAIAWKKDRVIDLETLLPIRGLTTNPNVVGSADGVAVIFISTDVGLFTIELKSDRVQKLSSTAVKHPVMPYTSFCTLGTEVDDAA